jgi:hypothetical protein
MRRARFRVFGRFDGATAATVEVDRAAGLFTVRPLRRRRTFTLPLAAVAEMVIWRIVRAEVAERRAARRKGRRS